MKIILITILIFLLLICSSQVIPDGDPCKAVNSVCEEIGKCKHDDPKSLNICGFDGIIPWVCCPITDEFGNIKEESISAKKCKYYKEVLENEPLILGIVGGKEAKLNEFPHMVALGYGSSPYDFRCGGTLISENFVLTAAHCLKVANYGDPTIARLGDHNLLSNRDGAKPINRRISGAFIHPEYKPPLKYNDIGLLKLANPVRLTKNIRPACLSDKWPLEQPTVTATGWGRTAYTGDVSAVLMKVYLNIIDEKNCSTLWSRKEGNLPRGIDHTTMICSGDLAGGKDTCLGDSGGPITTQKYNEDKNNYMFTVVGITSFGAYCGYANSPGIYTKVLHYVPWIESIVWN